MNRHAINTSVICSFFAALSSACLEHPVKPVELEVGRGDESVIDFTQDKRVDLLVVVDNSGSMGEEQANLGVNFGALASRLEDVGADYRIAVTTTDNGNPWCAGTGPEAGNFVLSPCTERLGQFTSLDGATNVEEAACSSICALEPEALEIQPSAVEGAGVDARPWIESRNGVTNLPVGTAPADAFSCFGPQGIDGCGFESPLESMYKSILRANDQGEDEYGFFRDGALLAILIVTDEEDCSSQVEWNDMFAADADNPFLENPDALTPTSAVCWNAGVSCEGAGGVYEYCEPANYDIDGNPTDDPERAVLHPVDRYVDMVREIGENTDRRVVVALIAGVPEGYEEGNTEIGYADAQDPGFQEDFGIGPGCTRTTDGVTQRAVPPVRLRAFAEAFPPAEGGNVFSVCDDDYAPALDEVAAAVLDEFAPQCANACIRDEDPSTQELDPWCRVTEQRPDGSDSEVVPCELGDEVVVPEGEDACWYARTDAFHETAPEYDDMHVDCVKEGNNLQFELVRRPGVEAPVGTAVSADCLHAEFTQVSCPAPGMD